MRDMSSTEILLFDVKTDGTFEAVGPLNMYEAIIWPDNFVGAAQFEVWAPITQENNFLFRKKRFVWLGGDNAAIIEIIKPAFNQDGVKIYDVKGRTLECLLCDRTIWGTYNAQNKRASTIMWEIVNQQCVSPLIYPDQRKIPFLRMADDPMVGPIISKQETGGDIYEILVSIAVEAELGFDITFDPVAKEMVFRITSGVDRTVLQSDNDAIEFSTDTEDVLSSSYYYNDQDEKNISFVCGEGEGAARITAIAGDNSLSGFERRELYVDARDLQIETVDENGNSKTLTMPQYLEVLTQRGNEKTGERNIAESYEARIRVYGGNQYEYGRDYFKGDMVTITDTLLDVQIHAAIVGVEESFSDEYALTLIFGFQFPTILQKITRLTT